MRNSKMCPKCGGEDIRRINGDADHISTANVIVLGAFKRVYVPRYLCISCGFMEEWIEEDDLKHFKTFPKVK